MHFQAKNCILYLIILVSCSNHNPNFTENPKKIEGKPISIDCMVGRPTMIAFDGSQHLMIYDRYDGQTMSSINLINHYCTRFLPEGKGPEEVLPAFRFYVVSENHTLGVYQFQSGIINMYDIKDIDINAKTLSPERKIHFDESPTAANIMPVDKYFIGIGMFKSGRVHLYDQQGNYISYGGIYPFNGEKMDPTPRFFAYQSYIASNPKGKQFVVASTYGDNLEFYTIKNDSVILQKKYETRDVECTFHNGMIQLGDNCLLGYKSACGSEKYCYLLFSGKTYAENNRKSYSAKYILKFKWDGQFVKSYEADIDILSFCIDEKNEIMYGIVNNEDETALMQFKL